MVVPNFLLLLLLYTMRSFKDIPSNQRPNQYGKLNLIPLPVTKSDIFPSNCFRVFLHNEPTSYAQTSSSSSSPPSCSLLTSSLIFLASVTSFKLSSSEKNQITNKKDGYYHHHKCMFEDLLSQDRCAQRNQPQLSVTTAVQIKWIILVLNINALKKKTTRLLTTYFINTSLSMCHLNILNEGALRYKSSLQ